jgi:molybdenum cofactor biosynthesis protein B
MTETSKNHKEKAPKSLSFAVITISTSRHQYSEAGRQVIDESGDLMVEKLKNGGHTIVVQRLIPDDKVWIQNTVHEMLKYPSIDAVITVGGTGITPSDVTIEAVQPLIEKELRGFGELFRYLTYQEIGSAAVMSRAIGGVAGGKAVFCLPGSPHAVELCLEKLILPEVGHIILHARGT